MRSLSCENTIYSGRWERRTDVEVVRLRVADVRIGVITTTDNADLRATLVDLIDPDPEAPADVTVPAVLGSVEETLTVIVSAAIDRSSALLLHSGVVVRDGVAIVLPGESGTGKSTLTAACLARGFGYATDEMMALDLDRGSVTGVPRPLTMTSWSAAAVGLLPNDAGSGKRAVLPSEFGAMVVSGPLSVGHVVLARRGAPVSALWPATAGEGVTALLAAAFNHFRFGAVAWESVAEFIRSVKVWQFDVADPLSAADELAMLVGEDVDRIPG